MQGKWWWPNGEDGFVDAVRLRIQVVGGENACPAMHGHLSIMGMIAGVHKSDYSVV